MVKFKVLQNNEMLMTRLWIFTHRLSDPAADFFKSFTNLLHHGGLWKSMF